MLDSFSSGVHANLVAVLTVDYDTWLPGIKTTEIMFSACGAVLGIKFKVSNFGQITL